MLKYKVYEYSELSEDAKEKVRQWLLDDNIRNELFSEDIKMYLEEQFPRSDLKYQYSLSSCQGDGLNIYGIVKMYEVLPKLQGYSEKEIKTLTNYFEKIDTDYKFESNNHYCYSCKFVDKKYIDDVAIDLIGELKQDWYYKNVNEELIKMFLSDIIDYFADLDKNFEKQGYEYLYNISDEEAKEECDCNDWVFFEDDSFTKTVSALDFQ